MGFISTGSGYKRHKTNPLFSSKPKVTPRIRSFASQNSLPSPSATPPPEGISSHIYEHPTLESLPVDVLLLIYNYVGVGEVNNITFINRYIHLVIPLAKEKWWMERLVRSHFVADLNIDVSDRWEAKFHRRYMKLPESVREGWSGCEFLNVPSILAQYGRCLDSRIFKSSFIDHQTVRDLGNYFGYFALDSDTIEREQNIRDKYVNWRYLVLSRMVETYQDTEEPLNIEEVQAQAEEAGVPKGFCEKHDLLKYTPVTQSGPIPVTMIKNLTPRRIEAILMLRQLFDMEIPRVGEFLTGLVKCCEPDHATTYLDQFTGLFSTYTYKDVVSLLQNLLRCREKVLKMPLDTRSSSPLGQLVERLYLYVEEALTLFYRQEQSDDEAIWELLKQLEIPQLIDLVVSLGGSPS